MRLNIPTSKDLDTKTMVHPPSVTLALKEHTEAIAQDEYLQVTTFNRHDQVFHSDKNHSHFL
jgi:hypothetical protein